MATRHFWFVLFQHGLNGSGSDFGPLAAAIKQHVDDHNGSKENPEASQHSIAVTTYACSSNAWFRSNDGVALCSARLAQEVVEALDAWYVNTTRDEEEACRSTRSKWMISVTGHSLGGVLARAALPHITEWASSCRARGDVAVDVVSYLSLASPHCGVSQIAAPLRVAAGLIGQVASLSISELLLDDGGDATISSDECTSATMLGFELVKPRYLEAWQAVKEHRWLFANVWNDPQVHFETSSLLLLPEDKDLLGPSSFVNSSQAWLQTFSGGPRTCLSLNGEEMIADVWKGGLKIPQARIGVPVVISFSSGKNQNGREGRAVEQVDDDVQRRIARRLRRAAPVVVVPVFDGETENTGWWSSAASAVTSRLPMAHDAIIGKPVPWRPFPPTDVIVLAAKCLLHDVLTHVTSSQ